MSAMDEDALVRKAVAGDGDALEALLLHSYDRLVAAVTRRLPDDVRTALSAEDVVQDTCIVAFQRIGSFEPRGGAAFFGWLAQIAEHRLMDAVKSLRAAKRGGGRVRAVDVACGSTDDILTVLEALPGGSRTPSRSAAAHDAVSLVTAALEALDPDYREALRLRYVEQQPVAACAAQLGRSEGAVHMLLGRALAALRERMGDSARYFTWKA